MGKGRCRRWETTHTYIGRQGRERGEEKMKQVIYLDNAATTKTAPEVVEAMLPYFGECYGNPSSIYSLGTESKKAVSQARETIAKSLGAANNEIYFTAGGTEADNWALKATAEAYAGKGKHIITSRIEHHAVLHTCAYLEKQGYEVTYVDVDENGILKLDALERAIRPDTILISVMYANNEIGTIQPIAELGAICREKQVIFHTDAVQAVGHLPIDLSTVPGDLLSLSGHKFHGPKGVGALYCRSGVPLTSFIAGGSQERGKRAGTENVAGICGMAAALEEACAQLGTMQPRVTALRDKLIDGVLAAIPRCRLNGHRTKRLPGNVSFCFEGIEGESMLLLLDDRGICASSGSACTSGSLDPSHVLLAIGRPHEVAHGSLRLSLCEENTEQEVDVMLREIPQVIDYLRNMSPVWRKLQKGECSYVIQ